jgi:hypothetical protein
MVRQDEEGPVPEDRLVAVLGARSGDEHDGGKGAPLRGVVRVHASFTPEGRLSSATSSAA